MRSPWPGLLLCRWLALWPGQSPGQLRGQLVDVELIAQFSGRDVVELLVGFLPEDIPSVFAQLIAGSNYDITALRVVYQTVDAAGEPDFASGLVVLPTADDLSRPPPIVVYHHGTLASDADVPSNLGAEALVGYILATDGYIAVLPDYLGFGVNTIPHHPYVHRRTQATASIDLLRAARAKGCAASGQPFPIRCSWSGIPKAGMRRSPRWRRSKRAICRSSTWC